MRKDLELQIRRAAEKSDKLETDIKGLMRAQFEGTKTLNAMPPPSSSSPQFSPAGSAASIGPTFGAGLPREVCTLVVGGFNGRSLQDECIDWLRKELQRRAVVGAGDISGRARRPAVLFVEMNSRNNLFRVIRRFRTDKIKHTEDCNYMWATMEKSVEERQRLRPVGKMCGVFRKIYNHDEQDVEVCTRAGVKVVLCTFSKWRTETVLGRLNGNDFVPNEEIIKGFDKGEEMWKLWQEGDVDLT